MSAFGGKDFGIHDFRGLSDPGVTGRSRHKLVWIRKFATKSDGAKDVGWLVFPHLAHHLEWVLGIGVPPGFSEVANGASMRNFFPGRFLYKNLRLVVDR
jgi:hypothetical protein